VVSGKYMFPVGDSRLIVLISAPQGDLKVWADDPEELKPQRMAPDLWKKLPPNCDLLEMELGTS
jgi:hypothetical protein